MRSRSWPAVRDEAIAVGFDHLNSCLSCAECDITVGAGGSETVRCAIAGFRSSLLAKHLHVSPAQLAESIERKGSVMAAIAALAHPDCSG